MEFPARYHKVNEGNFPRERDREKERERGYRASIDRLSYKTAAHYRESDNPLLVKREENNEREREKEGESERERETVYPAHRKCCHFYFPSRSLPERNSGSSLT